MSQKFKQIEQRLSKKKQEYEKVERQEKLLAEKKQALELDIKLLEAERTTALYTEYNLTFEQIKQLVEKERRQSGGEVHVSSAE